MNTFVHPEVTETTIALMPGVRLHRRPTALHVESDCELSCLSSAVWGGGALRTRHIINLGVPSHYRCGHHLDDLQCAARALGIAGPFVGLLTAARLEDAQVVVESDGQTTVAAIVTLGISHPTAAGVSTAAPQRHGREAGTINTIVLVDGRPAPGAHVNTLITATEAKSLALVEGSVHTPEGHLASGTGTDALVVACTDRGPWFEYGGPISAVGALVGRAVRSATLNALFIWQARQQVAEAERTTALV